MAAARGRVARNQFQAKLLALEKEQGMKPSHVARAAEMSLVYYQEIWSKNRVPSKDIILRIARALEEDPKSLLFLAERERAPAEAKEFFAIHQPARFPRLRRALMDTMANGEELEAELAKEPLGLLEKWIYYILLAHCVASPDRKDGRPRRFSLAAERFAVLLQEAAARGEDTLFVSVAVEMEALLEARKTQDEYVDLLKHGLSDLSYHNFVLELREKGPAGSIPPQPVRYVFMSDASSVAGQSSSQGSHTGPLEDLVQPEPHRFYEPESLRQAILYSPDFNTLEPGLKDLVYDETLFRSLRVTPNEFFFLRDAKVRGYGGEPLIDAYRFLLDQYRQGPTGSGAPLSDDEQRLLQLYQELNEEGKEEVLTYLEFTRSKARFKLSGKRGAITDQAG